MSYINNYMLPPATERVFCNLCKKPVDYVDMIKDPRTLETKIYCRCHDQHLIMKFSDIDLYYNIQKQGYLIAEFKEAELDATVPDANTYNSYNNVSTKNKLQLEHMESNNNNNNNDKNEDPFNLKNKRKLDL